MRAPLQLVRRPAKDRIPFRVKPMLATLVAAPFHKRGWLYEEEVHVEPRA
jgi:hypothetical protein